MILIEFDATLVNEYQMHEYIKKAGLQIEEAAEQREVEMQHGHKEDKHEQEHKHDHEGEEHTHSQLGLFGENTELIFSIICGVLLSMGFGLSFVQNISSIVPVIFYIAAYLFGGFFTVKEAVEAIAKGCFK